MKVSSKLSAQASPDAERSQTTPPRQSRHPVGSASPKPAGGPSSGGALPSAVLIERFEAKIAGGGIFLTLFGFGVRNEGAPLEHTPALTAYMSGRNAADLAMVLEKAVAVLRAPSIDQSIAQ